MTTTQPGTGRCGHCQEHAAVPPDHRIHRRGPLFASVIPRPSEANREHDRELDRLVAALSTARRRAAREATS